MVLSRLQNPGVHLRRDKCRLFQNSVDYLGQTISPQGIHTSDQKVNAIVNAWAPQNIQELRSFLGLLNYSFCAKFGNDTASTAPVIAGWSTVGVVIKVWKGIPNSKEELSGRTSPGSLWPTVAHYFSWECIGIIWHWGCDFPSDVRRIRVPSSFASWTLTASEQNYPQVEREALSLVFGIKHFHRYLNGRQFIILTHHKRPTTILWPKQGVPPLAAVRMQCWALMLSAYLYTIQFCPTEAHANADMLSRLPLAAQARIDNPVDTNVADRDPTCPWFTSNGSNP